MDAEALAVSLGKHTPKSDGGFMACCPAHDDRNPSLCIDEKDGVLLLNCFAGCKQEAVIEALRARNLWDSALPPARKPVTTTLWTPVLPVPSDTPPAPATHPALGLPSMTWAYLSADGDLLQLVYRFDQPNRKEFRPLSLWDDGECKKWRWQAIPDNRPLYGLDLIGAASHVLVCEGEKVTDASRRLLGDRLPVLTWSGGSNAVRKTDLTPLAGKTVAIWPDADEPGINAALVLCDVLAAIGCTVKVVEPPSDVEKGWDLAVAEAEGWTRAQVMAALKEALPADEFKERHNTELAVEKNTSGEYGDDEEPLLFDNVDTPEISPELLPGWLGEFVKALARSTQTPPDMAVMLALSTVATCTAKRFVVCPNGEGYCEPLNLWTATAMPPASRKTAVVTALTAPLADYEKEEVERLAPAIKESAIQRRVIERRIDKLEKVAANTDDSSSRSELMKDIARLAEEMPAEIISPRMWTGDITPERLQGLLVDHGERMAVLSDEGGIFEIMSGLYNDGKVNLDIFLKGHAGSSVRVDRQGRTAQLEIPALSFGLAIQPAILAEMSTGGKRRFRGNGTLARFLYTVPRSNVGSRDVRAVYQIPAIVAANYRTGIFNLLAIPQQIIDGRETPRKLTLTPEALECWYAFGEAVEQKQGPEGDLFTIADWSGKLPGAALRIAGNLHLVEHGANPPAQIEASTIERALDLCVLLIEHAKAAFSLMDADQVTGDSQTIFNWILSEGLERFRRGEVFKRFKSRFKGKRDQLDKALEELVARSIVSTETEKTAGRPAKVYIVNNKIWGGI